MSIKQIYQTLLSSGVQRHVARLKANTSCGGTYRLHLQGRIISQAINHYAGLGTLASC
jgi:hypothetical protein